MLKLLPHAPQGQVNKTSEKSTFGNERRSGRARSHHLHCVQSRICTLPGPGEPGPPSRLVLWVRDDVVVRDHEDEDEDAEEVGEEAQVRVVDHLALLAGRGSSGKRKRREPLGFAATAGVSGLWRRFLPLSSLWEGEKMLLLVVG